MTIFITKKKLDVQTKRPKKIVCYDFHSFGIYNEEEDVMFATKLNLFSIRTILPYIHIKLVSKLDCIPDLSIIEHVPKQPIESIFVFVINLIIPHDIVK